MKTEKMAVVFLAFLFLCSYTAPEADGSWWVWGALALVLLGLCAAAWLKARRRRAAQRRAKLVYFPPQNTRHDSAS